MGSYGETQTIATWKGSSEDLFPVLPLQTSRRRWLISTVQPHRPPRIPFLLFPLCSVPQEADLNELYHLASFVFRPPVRFGQWEAPAGDQRVEESGWGNLSLPLGHTTPAPLLRPCGPGCGFVLPWPLLRRSCVTLLPPSFQSRNNCSPQWLYDYTNPCWYP